MYMLNTTGNKSHGAFLWLGAFPNTGDSSNGSTTSRWLRAATAHHSNCENVREQYFCHRSSSSFASDVTTILPSRLITSCAFGICIMADTGNAPSSLRVVRSATPALVPPHWPAEYVTAVWRRWFLRCRKSDHLLFKPTRHHYTSIITCTYQ